MHNIHIWSDFLPQPHLTRFEKKRSDAVFFSGAEVRQVGTPCMYGRCKTGITAAVMAAVAGVYDRSLSIVSGSVAASRRVCRVAWFLLIKTCVLRGGCACVRPTRTCRR